MKPIAADYHSVLYVAGWTLGALLASVGSLSAESNGPYEMAWWTMDAAGAIGSTAGPHALSGTLGQIDSGVMTATPLVLTGGFWSIAGGPAFVSADFDLDGDVDYVDIAHFIACFTGSQLGPPAAGCSNTDLDMDGDVDLSDFARLQRCLSGSGIQPDPICGD